MNMAENDDQNLIKQFSELEKRHAVLEERMKTNYAETESALDRLRADIANWKTDMADWKTDMAKRDKDNLRWTVGFGVAQIAITIAVLAAGFAFLALAGMPTK